MAERKSLSKTIRFEVLKRDMFKCQYCGRTADDDVILEVDHITPVAEGGTNDIFNLVTSCRDCNRGKGKRKLSDRATAQKERKYLEDEQKRLEQSQMVIEWKKELLKQRSKEIDYINDYIITITGDGFNEVGEKIIRRLINEYGFQEVCTAVEISFDRYFRSSDDSWEFAFNKIGGVCYNRRKQRGEKSD